ncbi:E6 [Ursus maritimus papillomavirus 1]|uniref:Protein E6 n=1 Tax=Ursus maritimus papillomavirus 1 TaxID=461322 RepID=B2KKW7_9PAPI|nr:E6 [Ursus maritimus papillomavirus 1]ABV80245.1 E6 [Ursus maritimus papillomavirus 1]
MAENPRSVRDLCLELDIEVGHLNLNCVYCKKWLSASDKGAFDRKCLKLIWKKGFPYGVCALCLYYNLQVSLWRHFRRSAYGLTLEKETGIPLGDLLIRCMQCGKILLAEEKVVMVEEGTRFHNVCGVWRGQCLMCSAGVYF